MNAAPRLAPGEARSLLVLIEAAAESAGAAEMLEVAASRWREEARGTSRSLRDAALALAATLSRGETLASARIAWPPGVLQALRSAERHGDQGRGLALAHAALDRTSTTRRLVLTPLAVPWVMASLALAVAGTGAAFVASPVRDLVHELHESLGGPEPSPLLVGLAAHPAGVMAASLGLAGLLAALPLLVPLLVSTRLGSRVELRLPLAGRLARARASGEYAAALGPLLASRAPLDQAHEAAASAVSSTALRASLAARTPHVAAGDDLALVLDECGLATVAAAFRLAPRETDGGVHAAALAREKADELSRSLARSVGFAGATAAFALTLAVVVVACAAILVPLMTLGGT